MKSKTTLFVENIAESASSCLIMMVQGNMLLLTLGHWLIAMETGLFAGTIASALILKGRMFKPIVLGVITAIADYFVHSSQNENMIIEAVLTGIGASIISYSVSLFVRFVQRRIRFNSVT